VFTFWKDMREKGKRRKEKVKDAGREY